MPSVEPRVIASNNASDKINAKKEKQANTSRNEPIAS